MKLFKFAPIMAAMLAVSTGGAFVRPSEDDGAGLAPDEKRKPPEPRAGRDRKRPQARQGRRKIKPEMGPEDLAKLQAAEERRQRKNAKRLKNWTGER